MISLLLLAAAIALVDQLVAPGGDAPPTLRRVLAAALVGVIALAWFTRPPGAVPQKCIGRLLMPVGLIWLAGLTGAILALRRRPRTGALVLAGWLAFSAAGNDWLAQQGLAWLEAPYRDARPLEAGPFDAVFVLGGGVGPTPDGRPQSGMAGDRMVLAARLAHADRTERLIALGAAVPGYSIQDDAASLTAQLWRDLGVPAARIEVHQADAWNTRREVAAAAQLTRERGWQRVAILTSAWHLRRAMRHADREGLDATPLPADIRGLPRWDGLLTVIPNGQAFASVHAVCWELLGAAVGR